MNTDKYINQPDAKAPNLVPISSSCFKALVVTFCLAVFICVICGLFFPAIAQDPDHQVINANNWQYAVHGNAVIGHGSEGEDGGIYPRETTHTIYTDGFFWGGFIRDPNPAGEQVLRVGGHSHESGVSHGPIGEDGWPITDGRAKMWRIRKDYQTMSDAELIKDAADLFHKGDIAKVTASNIDYVEFWYAYDWENWPVDVGAPYIDVNNNGQWDPGTDEPGILNATQVFWLATNDLDYFTSTEFLGSEPIGLEYQLTIWSWQNQGNSGWPAQTIFQRHRLINKSTHTVDSMYIGKYMDANIGFEANDLAGCDTTLALGFIYNDSEHDSHYAPFNLPPPAVGYTLLQGPIVPAAGSTALFNFGSRQGYANLGLSSFIFEAPYTTPPDSLATYGLSLIRYNTLRGFFPTADIEHPTPYIYGSGPQAGQPTFFPLSGDPVNDPNGTMGDVDSEPGIGFSERKIMISSGPFTFAPGDTQEAVYALVGGIDPDGDQRTAISRLKEQVASLRNQFGANLATAESHIINVTGHDTEFQIEANLSGYENVAYSRLRLYSPDGSGPEFELSLVNDGSSGDIQANDEFWSTQTSLPNQPLPYRGDLVIHSDYGEETIVGAISNLQLSTAPKLINWRVLWENGQQDTELNHNESAFLAFDIANTDSLNPITSSLISVLNYGAGNAPVFKGNIPAGERTNSDSLYLSFTAPPVGDSIHFNVAVHWNGHTALQAYSFPLRNWTPAANWTDTLALASQIGISELVSVTVADPLELTGDRYAIVFAEGADSSLQWRLRNLSQGTITLDWTNIPDSEFDIHPVVDGVQIKIIDRTGQYGFANFQTVRTGNTVFDPPVSAALGYLGFPTPLDEDGNYTSPGDEQQHGDAYWVIHTADNGERGSYEAFVERTTRDGANWEQIGHYDYEMRFRDYDVISGWAWDPFVANTFFYVPFELWNIGIGTPDDDSDDYRMVPVVLDDDGNADFNMPIWGTRAFGSDEHSASSGENDPYTDWIYWMNPRTNSWEEQPGDFHYQLAMDSMAAGTYTGRHLTEVMSRMVLISWNGDLGDTLGQGVYARFLPKDRTWFRIVTIKPNFPGDSLTFQAPSPDSSNIVPSTTFLFHNYPNPFNSTTTIRFDLNAKNDVKLEVFDVLGREVVTIVDESLSSGHYIYEWHGHSDLGVEVSSGIYFYRLTVGDQMIRTRKMVLLK